MRRARAGKRGMDGEETLAPGGPRPFSVDMILTGSNGGGARLGTKNSSAPLEDETMPEDQNQTTTAGSVFSADDVRERYVPKEVHLDRLEAKTTRIQELQTKIGTYERQLLEAQPRLARVDELASELAKKDAAIQAAEDRVALARAGIVDDGAGSFLRMAFDRHVGALEAKPEDMAGAFRSWVGSEDGARSNPYVGHLFQGVTVAPEPATKTAAPGLPPVSRASVAAPTKAGGPLTQSQVQAEIGRIRALGNADERRAALTELRARQMGQR